MNPAYKTLKDSNKTISYSLSTDTYKKSLEETSSVSAAGSTLPLYKKYVLNSTQEQEWLDPDAHLTPEDLLTKPFLNINPHHYPYIKKHYNLLDNNFQNFCSVSLDSPIFFPSPKILLFTNYEPFVAVTKKLFFRNQDTSARRIRVIPPESPFFKVTPPLNPDGSPLPHSKIAGGMEVMIQVTFLPQEINDYEWDLQIVTEREEFIVPIRALGHRPKLILPQSIDFGVCPIKSLSSTKILIKNDGEIDAKIVLKSNLNKIFICPEHEVLIPSNSSLPLELNFMPIDTNPINDELVVEIISSGSSDGSSSSINKIKAFIAIKGVGKNIEVSLSSPSVTVEPSYISLFSQKIVKIRNLSDQKIQFQWKSFLNNNEEEVERDRLLNEINRIENEERSELLVKVKNGFYDNLNDSDNQEYMKINNNDEEFLTNDMIEFDDQNYANLPYQARIDEAILVRKFRNLRKALEVDKMLFVDDIFELSPLEGEIWPNSDLEVNVIFRPDSAANYSCLSFLDVIGRVDRLPLQLNGQGIGPNAQLSFEVLDLGDVFVNDRTEYDLEIKNKGDIPAQWTFMSSLTKFSSKFQFFPLDGYLLPGKSQKINISFESDLLGEFNEYFRFALQGNEDMLICQIKGHVIGPTFHFDRTCLDFNTVSFDCYHSEKIVLTNSSKIMMVYNLHIPQDGVYLNKEFNIVPSRGTLNPKESVEVLIEFIPNSVKKYEYSLAIDVLGVGDVLLSIPILADCSISTIKFELDANKELNFYDCFIRYPYEQDLKLINMSDVVHTKFEILPQPKHTISVVSYEVIPSVAVIEPGDFINLKVRLIGKKLGEYKVPLIVAIAGSQEPPLQCILHFNVIGPKIELNLNELKWGNILCLKNYQKNLIIKNNSLISASIKLFLKMAKSCYSLNIQNLVLNPEEEYDLEVIANLDDNILTKDELHFIVEEGDNLMIPLLAKGIGTTLFCEENLETLDLGVRLSNIWIEKQIVIENKGRRIQQLKWTNKTITIENQNRAAKAKKLNKDPNQVGKLPKNLAPLEPYFTMYPEEITLRPRTATVFTLKGFSTTPKLLNEVFTLESKIGKDRYMKQILESNVICQVVNPLLHFSSSEMFFEYVWEKNIPILIQKKEVTLTNSSDIILSFTLKCEVPFYVNIYDLILEPGASSTIEISFDPAYKGDFQSHLVESNLEIIYRGHPQKDVIKLLGNIVFPNLNFDVSSINFGSLLNNTSKIIKVRLSNPTKIDVKYHWIFLENGAQPSNTNSRAKSRNGPVVVTPPSHVFDILPINSVIQPENSEIAEFTMLSTMNFKLNSTVVCQVEGGPEYKFPILGETSDVSYELDTSVLDFGRVDFLQRMDKEINIKNNGRVPFNFSISALTDYDKKFLEFFPPEGKINGSSTGKIIVRMKPGIPENIKASFLLSIGHFDPVQIDCFCQGIFPILSIGLNRYRKIGPYGEIDNVTSSQWEEFQNHAISHIIAPNPKLLPPPIYPTPSSGSTANVPDYVPVHGNYMSLSDPNSLLPPEPPSLENDDMESVSLSLASSTKGLPLHQIDSEMQRLTLTTLIKNKVQEIEQKFKENPSQLVAINNEAPTNVASSTISPTKTKKIVENNSELPVVLQDLVLKYVPLRELVTARYVCDFGNVILGQTKKKIFKITNNSLCGALSWTFDKKYLSNTGFSIEPEKVLKLTEGSTVEFSVKYFAKTQQKLGLKQVLLPLEISENGPILHVAFIVNVCLPELEISESKIDFGKVLLGTSVKKYITLFNPTPVVANWSLRKGGLLGQSASNTKGKEENKVLISPSAGSLRPNKRVVIEVEYLPVDNAPLKSNSEYTLRVDLNKKNKVITILGENLLLPLTFDTNQVTIPPALPFSNGTEQIIKVTNSNLNYALEFFSVDFDSQYKEEDKMIECLDFDELGYYRTDLRIPGQSIPNQVKHNYEEYQKKLELLKHEENKEETQVESTEQNTEESQETSKDEELKVDEEVIEKDVLFAPPIRSFISDPTATPSYRDENKVQDFIILGPRFSGVSTLVQNIKKKLLISSFTFDNLIEDVSKCNDPVFGLLARRIIGKLSAEEQESIDGKLAISAQAVEQAKILAEESYKKEKKGKMKGDFPPEIYNTPELSAHNKLLDEMELNPANLSLLWKFRMQWEDMSDGMIIDGSDWSKYLSMDVLIQSLFIALPHIFIVNLNIPRGEDGYFEWVGHIQSIAQIEMERLKRSIEINSKQIIKFFKPVKSKSLDQFKTEVKTALSNKFFPNGIPTGEESWIDQNSGRVIELESNDFKSLDDKDKVVYLMQVLNQQFSDFEKVNESYNKIYQTLNPPNLPVDNNDENSPTEEAKIEDVENKQVENSFNTYTNTLLPLFTTLPKFELPIEFPVEAITKIEETDNLVDDKKPTDSEENVIEKSEEINEDVKEVESSLKQGGLIDIVIEGDESIDAILSLTLAQLPPPFITAFDKENVLPPTKCFQAYNKSTHRPNRRLIKNFRFVHLDDELNPVVPEPEPEVVPEPVVKGKKPLSAKSKAAAAAAAEAELLAKKQREEELERARLELLNRPPPSRWVIPPGETIELKIRFSAEKEASYNCTMEFEVVGTGQRFNLPCSSICEYPKINLDTRNLFMKRLKGLSATNPYPIRRFVIAENFYSFGPLPLFKKSSWIPPKPTDPEQQVELLDDDKLLFESIKETHSDIIRISNNGLYKAKVKLDWIYPEGTLPNPPPPLSAKPNATELANKANYEQAVLAAKIFSCEEYEFEIEEGDTKEVRIWALPTLEKEHKAILSLTVADNPAVTNFDVKCWGGNANLKTSGPWTIAIQEAEKALAANTDKKAVKDLEAKLNSLKESMLIDFNRVLVCKKERRAFTIENPGCVPIAWRIIPQDFENSTEISFNPTHGILINNQVGEVEVFFTSEEEKLLEGKFTLEFGDAEGCIPEIAQKVAREQADAAAAATKAAAEAAGNKFSRTLAKTLQGSAFTSPTLPFVPTIILPPHLGGQRVNYCNFKVNAESYGIHAVSLTQAGHEIELNATGTFDPELSMKKRRKEKGGPASELDFGLVRVGDYAIQTLKMGNKGKYKIAYNFKFLNEKMRDFVTISPMEGTIESANSVPVDPKAKAPAKNKNAEPLVDPTSAEIQVTFCSKENSSEFNCNSDIMIQILEPLTGEIVEEFPLLITVKSIFSSFRVQPSRGLQFGALRFDGAQRSKKIEIKNDSDFEWVVFACPTQNEVEEFDLLEDNIFSALSYACPPALRALELGESYKNKAWTIDGPPNTAKGGKAPPKSAKGKGKDTGSNEVIQFTTLNPLVQDIDRLACPPLTLDPLSIGAFTIHPQLSVVQPGQFITIECKFDPAAVDFTGIKGSGTSSSWRSAKENIRLWISGSDPKDSFTKSLRSFELVGESCLPAIVTNEWNEIFEEQEVVSSLTELSDKVGHSSYAITENTLTFGHIPCVISGISAPSASRGKSERIKIINPTKIDVKVSFKLMTPSAASTYIASKNAPQVPTDKKGTKTPKAPAKGGKGKDIVVEETVSPFYTTYPEVWEIPPHEHRFVTINFSPSEIKKYDAVFIAEIEDSNGNVMTVEMNNSKTLTIEKKDNNIPEQSVGSLFNFNLTGSGTLPLISLASPTEKSSDGGKFLLSFPKTLIGKKSKKKIIIRNDGILPATCLFEMNQNNDFYFPLEGSSLTLQPGGEESVYVEFKPNEESLADKDKSCQLKIIVLNNVYSSYNILMTGEVYSCDATFQVPPSIPSDEINSDFADDSTVMTATTNLNPIDDISDHLELPDLNLLSNNSSSSSIVYLQSNSDHPLKFELVRGEELSQNITFSPSLGHLAPRSRREITITLSNLDTPIEIIKKQIICKLQKIAYPSESTPDQSLRGFWDDSMKSIRPAIPEDLKQIQAYNDTLADYNKKVEAEAKKGKKAKPVGPPPSRCLLELVPTEPNQPQMVYEVIAEPTCTIQTDNAPQQQSYLTVSATADSPTFVSSLEKNDSLKFNSTYLFQTSSHKFTVKNTSKIKLPVKFFFDNLNKKTFSRASMTSEASRLTMTTPSGQVMPQCPFKIEPEEVKLNPNEEKEFTLSFSPLDAGDFLYSIRGVAFPSPSLSPILVNSVLVPDAKVISTMNSPRPTTSSLPGVIPTTLKELSQAEVTYTVLHGPARRPIIHFDMVETLDYLSRREPNLKNELGIASAIETNDLKIVELESVGLKTRNVYRFFITNTTNESYEFVWESQGEPSPAWRCIQTAGMLFPGKRVEIIFEYIPDDVHVAESFFKFTAAKVGISQMFLFTGHVKEPKVAFSTSKLDFHSVMLGGEGCTEVIYLENNEHLPFQFSFDKYSLMQLEGPLTVQGKNGAVENRIVNIFPLEGTVPSHGRIAITMTFLPHEEVVYNFNLICFIKRKPNKLSINLKGEGYSVHPIVQLEQPWIPEIQGNTNRPSSPTSLSDPLAQKYIQLKPLPATNIADFGAVQVLDSLTKAITVTNAGKYNFDYNWNIDKIGSMLALTAGKLNGTLLKGDQTEYKLTFAPMREGNLDNSRISFTVAGKYTYEIIPKGLAVKPALRFSFMHHDFGNCFITSPGGSTVVEEVTLMLKNHDPEANITVECVFPKMRALWIDCPPTVLAPNQELPVKISFAPREVKEYSFSVPFLVNGSGKVQVNIHGKGINARLELVNGAQRKTNFGIVNVNGSSNRQIMIINKSKKALPLKLKEGGEFESSLRDKDISFTPNNEVILAPKETLPIELFFKPTKRVSQFTEDLFVEYAGLHRVLLTLSGKARGLEASLDTDCIPFGKVVLDSKKVKKLTLENAGDLTISFQWDKETFGQHFSITPLSGKILPGNELIFDVTFRPKFEDSDIRQDNLKLHIVGMDNPLLLSCSGQCIKTPTENVETLTFHSSTRKNEVKTVKLSNPTDKDWYVSPSLQGVDWKVPFEFKIPAKGTGEMPITYFPLTMTNFSSESSEKNEHQGKLFIALPDGSARLYELRGTSSPPESSGKITLSVPAKKSEVIPISLSNWLGESQKLDVTVTTNKSPSPATFFVAANTTEVGPNGTKEFPVRFISYCEGLSEAVITFTNPNTHEYCFYNLEVQTTMAEIFETYTVEAPVRQSARVILSIENPLGSSSDINMGSVSKPTEWWTSDSKFIRVKELSPLSGRSEGAFEIEYRPLLLQANPSEHLVTIITQELGTFKYKIIAKSTNTLLKNSLKFEASLGTKQKENFKFKVFNTSKIEFACKITPILSSTPVTNESIFTVQNSLVLEPIQNSWDGEEILLPIIYEPTSLGSQKFLLTLTSTDGGVYTCELEGNCTPPLPQGPYEIVQGGAPYEILFRNCFNSTTQWSISLDASSQGSFNITTPTSVTLNAKAEGRLALVFEPPVAVSETMADGAYINTKLFLSCTNNPSLPPWVYYLRGKINKSAPPPKGKK